ncbi:hypothetical protein [Rhodoligotrophos ferricapiens]|uniref:hypothetical protein n=1 Tax=Rhodoligotrophos ferricapiens TaxID=3069264 RepID=UPI00315C8321
MPAFERTPPAVLAAILGLLVALSVGIGAVYLLREAQREGVADLAHTTEAGAEAVGRAVADQLDRALGYGIPLARMRGVEAYLQKIVEGSPQVQAIAVLDTGGKPLFATGNVSNGLTFPLRSGGTTAGTIALQPAPPLVASMVTRLDVAIAAASLFCGLMAGLVAYLFIIHHLRSAERRLANALIEIQQGRTDINLHSTGRGVVRDAFAALDQAVQPIRNAKRRVEDAAATVRAIDFDGSLREKLDDLLHDAAFQPAPEASRRPSGSAVGEDAPLWPAAIIVACYCAAAPLIANYAIDREWSLVSRPWWPSIPIVIEILAGTLACLIGARLAQPTRRIAGAIGLLIAAVATASLAFTRSYDLFLALRLASGAGFGLLLAAVFAGPRGGREMGRAWRLVLFAGTCAGPLFGGLIAEAIGRRLTFLAIGAALIITTFLIPRLQRPKPVAAVAGVISAFRIMLLTALGVVLGAIALVWIPSQPGYDNYLIGGGLIAGLGLAAVVIALVLPNPPARAALSGLAVGMMVGATVPALAQTYGIAPLSLSLALAAALFLLALVLALASGGVRSNPAGGVG